MSKPSAIDKAIETLKAKREPHQLELKALDAAITALEHAKVGKAIDRVRKPRVVKPSGEAA